MEKTKLVCPRCGSPLVVRTGRHGEFLGCSTYPKCKFTSNFERAESGEISIKEGPSQAQETGIKCEKCGKPMVIKRGRRGEFLACSGYPECRNIKNFKRNEKGGIEIVESKAAAVRAVRPGLPAMRQAAGVQARKVRAVPRLLRLPRMQIHPVAQKEKSSA